MLYFLFWSNHSTIFHQTLDHVFLPYLNHFHSVSKGYSQNRLDDKHLVVLHCVFRWFLFFLFKFSSFASPAWWGRFRSERMFSLNETVIVEHALVFQIFSVVLRMFLIKNFDPDWFSCKPFPPKCLIHYYCLPCLSSVAKGVLHVICALPPSVRNVIVNIKILHVGKLFFTRTFNFKRLSKTVRDGKFLASFVPICKIMLLSFFWIHGIR